VEEEIVIIGVPQLLPEKRKVSALSTSVIGKDAEK